jgi:hypothetical protein
MSRLLTRLSIAFLALACVAIGSAVAGLEFADSDGVPPYFAADFDRAFADVAAQPWDGAQRDMIEAAARTRGDAITSVNRAGKSDRLQVGTNPAGSGSATNTVRKNGVSPGPAKVLNGAPDTTNSPKVGDATPVAKPIPAPYCEPVASPFVDPALGRITGHCFA